MSKNKPPRKKKASVTKASLPSTVAPRIVPKKVRPGAKKTYRTEQKKLRARTGEWGESVPDTFWKPFPDTDRTPNYEKTANPLGTVKKKTKAKTLPWYGGFFDQRQKKA